MIGSEVSGVLGEIGRKRSDDLLEQKKFWPVSKLQDQRLQNVRPRSIEEPLRNPGWQIIAEVKFKSPSKGAFKVTLTPIEVALGYLNAGAAALSVLTEPYYFGGDIRYLRHIREQCPEAYLLMKDFIFEEYQLEQALWAGADAVLLIVALLGPEGCARMLDAARRRGLEPLVEVHDDKELAIALNSGARIIGINNRNLKDLSISLDTTMELAKQVPADVTLVGESGIEKPEHLRMLKAAGCHGFLIGSSFMATGVPGQALHDLLQGVADCRM